MLFTRGKHLAQDQQGICLCLFALLDRYKSTSMTQKYIMCLFIVFKQKKLFVGPNRELL